LSGKGKFSQAGGRTREWREKSTKTLTDFAAPRKGQVPEKNPLSVEAGERRRKQLALKREKQGR